MSRYALHASTLLLVAALGAGCDHDTDGAAFGDCNGSGCFGCTDNTMQSCWPLPYDPCKSDAECSPGHVCTTLGCAETCTTADDCRPGEVCTAAGYCAPSNAKTTPVGGNPTNPNNPGNPPISSEPGVIPCLLDSHCYPGQACVAGKCTHSPTCGIPATMCNKAADCGAGRDCLEGKCHATCAGSGCPIGQVCSSGLCIDTPNRFDCVFDYQCGAASRCINRVCHPLCGVDAQCGKGEFCDSGVCRADIRPALKAR